MKTLILKLTAEQASSLKHALPVINHKDVFCVVNPTKTQLDSIIKEKKTLLEESGIMYDPELNSKDLFVLPNGQSVRKEEQ